MMQDPMAAMERPPRHESSSILRWRDEVDHLPVIAPVAAEVAPVHR
jgi:hypothetical protein